MKKENENGLDLVREPFDLYNVHKDFTSLEAWKKCHEVKIFFYKDIIPKLPRDEEYNLKNQIKKAAISITANIAEGYGRFYYQEAIQFFRISRGSLYELKDHLLSCRDLNYIDQKLFDRGIELIENAKVTLNGFINYVLRKIKS